MSVPNVPHLLFRRPSDVVHSWIGGKTGQPQIQDLHNVCNWVYHYVFWVDVVVQDSPGMKFLETLHHLSSNIVIHVYTFILWVLVGYGGLGGAFFQIFLFSHV